MSIAWIANAYSTQNPRTYIRIPKLSSGSARLLETHGAVFAVGCAVRHGTGPERLAREPGNHRPIFASRARSRFH